MAYLEDGGPLYVAAIEAMPLVLCIAIALLTALLYRVWRRPTWGRFGNSAFLNVLLIVSLVLVSIVVGSRPLDDPGGPVPNGVLWLTMMLWTAGWSTAALAVYLIVAPVIVLLRRRSSQAHVTT